MPYPLFFQYDLQGVASDGIVHQYQFVIVKNLIYSHAFIFFEKVLRTTKSLFALPKSYFVYDLNSIY